VAVAAAVCPLAADERLERREPSSAMSTSLEGLCNWSAAASEAAAAEAAALDSPPSVRVWVSSNSSSVIYPSLCKYHKLQITYNSPLKINIFS